MIILKAWIFRLSDIDQIIHIHAKQNIGIFIVCEKFIEQKRKKKSNISVSKATLCAQKIFLHAKFFYKMFVSAQNSICDWKENDGKKVFVVAIKKMQVIQFPAWKLYHLYFFEKCFFI